MPTFVSFQNGEAVKQIVGANPQGLEVGWIYVSYIFL
jgi:hypothetical protein